VGETIDSRIERIGRHHFRAKFHLRGRDRGLAQLHGRSACAGTRAS
jgi:hypothetical protein